MSLGLDMGPGGVISAYTANTSPSNLLFYTSLRATYDLKSQWAGGGVFWTASLIFAGVAAGGWLAWKRIDRKSVV